MAIVSRRHRHQQPRNNGSVNIARSSLDQITPMAVRQQENALAVNSFPILYYRRKLTGLRCTCCGAALDEPPPEPTVGVQVLDAEGKGTQEYINTMLHGTSFSINRYGSRDRVDANGGDVPQRSLPNGPLVRSNATMVVADDLDDPFADVVEEIDPDDRFDTGVENNASITTSTTGCAVCLGTGFVGGFDPLNAMRTVYDTQYPDWSGDIRLDDSVQPQAFIITPSLDGESEVTVPVLLPRGAQGIDCIRVWNNREQLTTSIRIELLTEDGYIPAGTNLIARCDGLTHLLRIRFDPSLEHRFTHLEIQFDMGTNPIYANWSRMSFSENLATADNMANPSLVLTPTIPSVNLKDIVIEDVHNRIWTITDVSGGMDREKRLHGWSVTCRVTQKYELVTLLPHRRLRTYYSGNRVQQQPRDVPGDHQIEPYTAGQQTKYR